MKGYSDNARGTFAITNVKRALAFVRRRDALLLRVQTTTHDLLNSSFVIQSRVPRKVNIIALSVQFVCLQAYVRSRELWKTDLGQSRGSATRTQ